MQIRRVVKCVQSGVVIVRQLVQIRRVVKCVQSGVVIVRQTCANKTCGEVCAKRGGDSDTNSVSYTHLTLPTRRTV